MESIDTSGARHRGKTKTLTTDNNLARNAEVKPASTLNLPVAKTKASTDFVARQYIESIDPITGKMTLIWFPPLVPYQVETVEQKGVEPISALSILSEALVPLNVINIAAYLGLLVANIKGESIRNKIVPAMFTIGQTIENLGSITEGVWRTVLNVARDRTPRPTLRIVGNNVPTVDIFITCCGEPDDVVLDTVKAACNVDWPADKLRVVLADDGQSEVLCEQVGKLQHIHTNLHYYAREKPAHKHHGYKAGNLNSTLFDYVEKLPLGYSEYFAVFDADMMPEPGVLRQLVPHAIEDSAVGMVTAAQFHYNIPTNDILNQGNTTGTGAEDGARDRVNAAWCPGSGFVMRTEAWNSIGKFPEFSITEDLITSWFLHGNDWRILLIPGVMQWGLQPDCLLTHLKQRRRWWTGHIRDALRFNFTLSEKALDGASFIQRYAMLQHAIRPYTMTVTHTINTLLTLLCLWIGGPFVAASNARALQHVVGCLALIRIAGLFGDVQAILSSSYLKARSTFATGVWLGHHFSRDTLLSLLPQNFGGLRLGFGVSGVDDNRQIAVKERDLTKRPSFFSRLWTIHQREGILWHVVLFVVTVYLIASRINAHLTASMVDGKVIVDDEFWFNFICSVGFPGLLLIDNVPMYLTPLVYVMFPPTMPERRETMERDENGLWKPIEEYKNVKYNKAS